MDLKRAEQIIQDYHELKNLVDAAGRKKLAEKTKANEAHYLRYLGLDGFYCDNGHVVVEFSYNEPYSGYEEVSLKLEDLNA